MTSPSETSLERPTDSDAPQPAPHLGPHPATHPAARLLLVVLAAVYLVESACLPLVPLAARGTAGARTAAIGVGALAVAILACAAALHVRVAVRPSHATRPADAAIGPVGIVVAALALAGSLGAVQALLLAGPWTAPVSAATLVAAAVLLRGRDLGVAVTAVLASWVGVASFGVVHTLTGVQGSGGPTGWRAWLFTGATMGLASAVAYAAARLVAVVHEETVVERRQAQESSVLDPVTGLSNRQGLEMVAGPMLENARRSGQAVHCLFVDVDDFRTVNEHVGLQAGDAVLQSVAEAVLGSVRGTDVVARWAGDEFVVIGPGTGTSPLELERRVKAQLAASPPVPAQVWTGRVSIGSATLVPWDDGDLDSLLRRADQDMVLRRSLRRQGRDRVSGLQGPLAAAREVAVDDEDDAPARIVDGDASA